MENNTFNSENLQNRFPGTRFLDNGIWSLALSTYGGQLLKARHSSSVQDVIFLGKKASAANGHSIRGGVPVCWPWFGASPVPGRPIQGFARTAHWEVKEIGKDFIRMDLPSAAVPPELVDFPFELFTEIRLTDELELRLGMKNCGTSAAEISCALHTYFAVSDIANVRISGLDGAAFEDRRASAAQVTGHVQDGEVAVDAEVDRLYTSTTADVIYSDLGTGRSILVEKLGSYSTVVWNPWIEKAKAMPDFGDQEFRKMICIEAANAGSDSRILIPGVSHTLAQKITVL